MIRDRSKTPRMARKTTVKNPRVAKKQMILQALTDPRFRRMLQKEPEKAVGKAKLTAVQVKEIELVLQVVKGIDRQIAGMADKLLCNNGGCSVVV